jgi:hypothetical protein
MNGKIHYKINQQEVYQMGCKLPIEAEEIKQYFHEQFKDIKENTIVSYDIYGKGTGLVCKHFFHV